MRDYVSRLGYAQGRYVAIKECCPSEGCVRDTDSPNVKFDSDKIRENAIQKIVKESQALARVQAPGVVISHDFFLDNNTVYCVMRWLDGESLGQIMDKIRCGTYARVCPEKVRSWLVYILHALKEVHRANIVHRDIKPENIVFDSKDDGNPVLVDLGSAAIVDSWEEPIPPGGYTPAFAPPEQRLGYGKVGVWTDFYSLAATFYELVTNIRVTAFQGEILPEPDPQYADDRLAASLLRNLKWEYSERCKNVDEWLKMLHAPVEQTVAAVKYENPLQLTKADPIDAFLNAVGGVLGGAADAVGSAVGGAADAVGGAWGQVCKWISGGR